MLSAPQTERWRYNLSAYGHIGQSETWKEADYRKRFNNNSNNGAAEGGDSCAWTNNKVKLLLSIWNIKLIKCKNMPSDPFCPQCSCRVDVHLFYFGHLCLLLPRQQQINSKAEFSENLHPGRSFSKNYGFIDLKVCFYADKRSSRTEKSFPCRKYQHACGRDDTHAHTDSMLFWDLWQNSEIFILHIPASENTESKLYFSNLYIKNANQNYSIVWSSFYF